MGDKGAYLLGLDAGNTVIKAVLFDLDGMQIASSAMDGQSHTPHPGHVERDLNELWRNAAKVIRNCVETAGVDASDIVSIGCAGHGNGLYLLDRADAPLLGIQSLDTRASQLASGLDRTTGPALRSICLQNPWPSQTPTLLAWVKQNRPELYAQIGTAFMCKDFIAYQLTGRRVSDVSDMSGAGMLKLPEGRYDDDLLGLYGLDDARAMLPDLAQPTEVIGRISAKAAAQTGLTKGTPVVGGLFDVIASALGSGAAKLGQASIIAGTWSINQVITDAPVVDDRIFMTSVFGPNRFMAIESSATSAANLEWFVRELIERGHHHDNPFGQCNDTLLGVVPMLDDPLYHPYLYGSALGAEMRAGFYGIAGWHREGHLLRALFEGVTFEHLRHVASLRRAGVSFDAAILSGGGSRSPVWPQMFADILELPVTTAVCQETGALGAAIAAGIGIGCFEGFEEGSARMTNPKQHFTPDPTMAQHYRTRAELFADLTQAMMPVWTRMHELKETAQA
ncbi:FGGY-family carbohydrate kinase [Qingshengfaniella alkalisoli]|uniref:Carbohydrate kinase n=1 Tax=Qingshengfaniella alkalisoli TaxID=2599296 RepID=A0A5B8IWH6_9RHOB|nr:FGGY-family carbohydrate kinase [Qingshengfaniella alkalisoli]QDY70512.1 carbohydrate kinase [Qingshengfaniella alkalisoli]